MPFPKQNTPGPLTIYIYSRWRYFCGEKQNKRKEQNKTGVILDSSAEPKNLKCILEFSGWKLDGLEHVEVLLFNVKVSVNLKDLCPLNTFIITTPPPPFDMDTVYHNTNKLHLQKRT